MKTQKTRESLVARWKKISTQRYPTEDDDEIALTDLLKIFREGWLWILGTTALTLGAALFYLFIAPSFYEAKALVELGSYRRGGLRYLEQPSNALARVRKDDFQRRVVIRLGGHADPRATRFLSSFKTSLQGELIELRVLASTPDNGREALAAVVDELNTIYRQLYKASFSKLTAERDNILRELDDIKKQQGALPRLDHRLPAGSQVDLLTLSYLTLQATTQQRTHDLERQLFAINEELATDGGISSRLLGDINVTAVPISPPRYKILLLGLVGGILAGVIVFVLRYGWPSSWLASGTTRMKEH